MTDSRLADKEIRIWIKLKQNDWNQNEIIIKEEFGRDAAMTWKCKILIISGIEGAKMENFMEKHR